jgi:hypothetical protein
MNIVINSSTGARGSYADWVEEFTQLWQAGQPRVHDFMSIMSPDIKLIAPGLKPTTGAKACQQAFEKTFEVLPDLTAQVHRWSVSNDALFIEMTFTASIGGRKVSWANVDRFIFRDGMAIERVAYFNPSRVRKAFLRGPRGWLHLIRRIRSGL